MRHDARPASGIGDPGEPADRRDRRVAVGQGHGANTVYQRLRNRGYEVFPVNPNAEHVEGDPCFPDLANIPGGVDAVVLATRPDVAEATMRECAELGIQHVWTHRLAGDGSVCDEATVCGREHGITVIDGGCPLMFEPTSDFVRKLPACVDSEPARRHTTCDARHHAELVAFGIGEGDPFVRALTAAAHDGCSTRATSRSRSAAAGRPPSGARRGGPGS